MVYSLVDFVNSLPELLAGKSVVSAKLFLEGVHVLFEILNIYLLVSYDGQLPLILQGIKGSVAKQGYDSNKHLRSHNIHLLMPVGHIHYSAVIQLAVCLKG